MRGRLHRAWQTSVSVEQKCEHFQGGWWGAYVSGTCPCHAKDKKGDSAHSRLGTTIAWGVSSALTITSSSPGLRGSKGCCSPVAESPCTPAPQAHGDGQS